MYNGQVIDVPQFIADAVSSIKTQVGNDVVVLGLSGGVDSTVTALLVDKAIGDRLVCIFVDHGLLRKNEFEDVLSHYEGMGLNVKGVRAADRFFAACKGIASESLPAHIIRGTIELHGPDGSTEKLKGVPIPRVCFWIDDHRKWWDWERCFLACLISLFEWTGEAASCQWYEGWKNALQIVEDFLFRGMPEPNRRFWNLLHYEDTKIPEWGNHVVKQCADSYLTSIPREILEQYFPKTS